MSATIKRTAAGLPLPTPEQVPAFFQQFTPEQMRAQYTKNLRTFEGMLEKAERTGKKVGGYTADRLRAHVEQFAYLAENFGR
jgi:rubrerythrin